MCLALRKLKECSTYLTICCHFVNLYAVHMPPASFILFSSLQFFCKVLKTMLSNLQNESSFIILWDKQFVKKYPQSLFILSRYVAVTKYVYIFFSVRCTLSCVFFENSVKKTWKIQIRSIQMFIHDMLIAFTTCFCI